MESIPEAQIIGRADDIAAEFSSSSRGHPPACKGQAKQKPQNQSHGAPRRFPVPSLWRESLLRSGGDSTPRGRRPRRSRGVARELVGAVGGIRLLQDELLGTVVGCAEGVPGDGRDDVESRRQGEHVFVARY